MALTNPAQKVVLLQAAQFKLDLRCQSCISSNVKYTLFQGKWRCTACSKLDQECLFTRTFEKTAGPLAYNWDIFTSESARGALTATMSTLQQMQGHRPSLDSSNDDESSTLKDDFDDRIERGDQTRPAQVEDNKKSDTTREGQEKGVQAPAATSPLPAVCRKVAKATSGAMKQPQSNKDATINASIIDPMAEDNSVQSHVKKTVFKLPRKRPAARYMDEDSDEPSSSGPFPRKRLVVRNEETGEIDEQARGKRL